LRSRLELALLDSVLGDRDALPLVHPKRSVIRTKPGRPGFVVAANGCGGWIRTNDLRVMSRLGRPALSDVLLPLYSKTGGRAVA